MPRMYNPIQQTPMSSPLGDAAKNLLGVFMAMPGPDERAKAESERIYREALTGKAQQDVSDAQRKAGASKRLGELFAEAYGPAKMQAPPAEDFVGPMPPMSRDQQVRTTLPRLAETITDAGSVGQLGEVFRVMAANADGTTDPMVSRAMLGAGGGMSSTPMGFAQDQQRQRDTAKMATDRAAETQDRIDARNLVPVMENGQWVYRRKVDAVGSGAPAPQTAQQTPRNYIQPDGRRGFTHDGLTDAVSKAPIAQGSQIFTGQVQSPDVGGLTKPVQTDLQRGEVALADFNTILDETLKVAQTDPALFGTVGNVRRLGQGAVGQVDALSSLMGMDQFDSVAVDLQRAGVAPQFFDPNLNDVDRLATLAAYKAASTLAAQEGKGLSNQDFHYFRQIVGDPTAWLSSQQSFVSGLNKLKTVANGMAQNRRAAFGPQTQSGAAPAPAAAPAAGGSVMKWTRDANGRPVPAGGTP